MPRILRVPLFSLIIFGVLFVKVMEVIETELSSNSADESKQRVILFEHLLGIDENNKAYVDENGILKVGEKALNNLKETDLIGKFFDAAAIFKDDICIATTIVDEKGEKSIGTPLNNEDIRQKVYNGETVVTDVQILNKNLLGIYAPLWGYNNKVEGILFLGKNMKNSDKNIDRIYESLIKLFGIAVFVSLVVFY